MAVIKRMSTRECGKEMKIFHCNLTSVGRVTLALAVVEIDIDMGIHAMVAKNTDEIERMEG